MIENLQAHYGFTRSPFGKALAPQMLHRHNAHGEAVARIGWCLTEKALGVITGEVGAGKTVAVRAALAGLDASRTTIVYLGNPAVGARGLYAGIVLALGGTPSKRHLSARLPAPGHAAHPCLADAPGGPLPARVQSHARQGGQLHGPGHQH